VRGFRIEPEEIEAALAAHPGVRAAAVVARPGPGGPSLLACVVPVIDDGALETAELRVFLAERLPASMVPAEIAVLPRLPLTANGKVDRHALEEMRPELGPQLGPRRSDGAGSAPPRTPAESLLAGIWREILGVDRVERGDNFFALGGHSLLATRMV
jgi:yersiniabactin nonribosomal peptide synthetase